jgi:hypothetical protein
MKHEIVDAAGHLLGKDHAGQGALGPDEDQRRQRQRKADRQPTGERQREAHQHQRARRRHGIRNKGIAQEKDASHNGKNGGRAKDTSPVSLQQNLGGKHRHAGRAQPHRIESKLQRQAGARGLSSRDPAEFDGVEGDIGGDDQHQRSAHVVDDAPPAFWK